MATSSSSSTSRSWQWWVNAVAFVSLVIIGIVLLLAELGIGGGDLTSAMRTIGNALAYIVAAACAFVYASGKMRRKNGIWYMIIWVVAVVLIVIAIIIPAVS